MSFKVYPKNMQYYLSRLSNFHKQGVRLSNINNSTGTAGDVIQVQLPALTLVDLGSFKMHFNCTVKNPSGARQVAMPRNIASVIERLEIAVNGQTLQQGHNSYNVLYNVLENITVDSNGRAQRWDCGAENAALVARDTSRRYVIRDWLGWLGTVSPSVIPTHLMGDIILRITLAENNNHFLHGPGV